jgi:hypothetical protein
VRPNADGGVTLHPTGNAGKRKSIKFQSEIESIIFGFSIACAQAGCAVQGDHVLGEFSYDPFHTTMTLEGCSGSRIQQKIDGSG